MPARIRRELPCALLILLLASAYLPWARSDLLGSLGGDAAMYVMMARTYAPFLPDDSVALAVAVDSQFPPLYPLLLALTPGAADSQWAHAVTTLCLIAAFAAFYAWLLALAVPRGLALVGVALFALLPETLLQALYLHSESLYLALSLAALAVLGRVDRPSIASTRSYWVASGLIAALLLTRTAGVALLPAFAAVLLRVRPRHWAWMLTWPVVPAAIFAVLNRPERDYGDGMLAHYAGMSATELGWSVAYDAMSLTMALAKNLVSIPSLGWVALVVAIVALPVATARALRLRADAAYFFTSLGLVLVWPYPAEDQRLTWVIVPLLIGYALVGGLWLAHHARVRSPVVRGGLLALIPLALALNLAPGLHRMSERYHHPLAEQRPGLRDVPEWYVADVDTAQRQAELHLDLVEGMRELGALVPPGDCVFSIKPAVTAYYGGRRSAGLADAQADDTAFQSRLTDAGCRYFLLLDAASPSYTTPYYPLQRLQDELETLAIHRGRSGFSQAIAALAQRRPT